MVSSCVAIRPFSLEPITVDETVWNDAAVKECEEKGVNADGLTKYSASKTASEKGELAPYSCTLVIFIDVGVN